MKLALLWCAVFAVLSWLVWGEVPWQALTAVIAVVGVLLCMEYEHKNGQ